jgi:hypothetical protein
MAGKRKRQNRTGDDGDDFLKICGIDIRPDLFFFQYWPQSADPFLFISLTSNLLPAVTGPLFPSPHPDHFSVLLEDQ